MQVLLHSSFNFTRAAFNFTQASWTSFNITLLSKILLGGTLEDPCGFFNYLVSLKNRLLFNAFNIPPQPTRTFSLVWMLLNIYLSCIVSCGWPEHPMWLTLPHADVQRYLGARYFSTRTFSPIVWTIWYHLFSKSFFWYAIVPNQSPIESTNPKKNFQTLDTFLKTRII